VRGQLDDLVARAEGHAQQVAPTIHGERRRIAGQSQPTRRLDALPHRVDEQGLAARVTHVAPRAGAAVRAREVRGAETGRRAAQAPAAGVAQLDDPLAPHQDDGTPIGQSRHVPRRADRRGQLSNASRPTAGGGGGHHRDGKTRA
jgi:hypothetical protein